MANKTRRPNPAASSKKENLIVRAGRSVLLLSVLLACGVVTGLFERRVVLPQCAESGIQDVVSNMKMNGVLVRDGMEVMVRAANGHERIIVKCVKTRCTGPYQQLEKVRSGALAHAEFCGPFVTAVAVNRVLVYSAQPPTQTDLDREVATSHKVGLYALLYALAVISGAVTLFVRGQRHIEASR